MKSEDEIRAELSLVAAAIESDLATAQKKSAKVRFAMLSRALVIVRNNVSAEFLEKERQRAVYRIEKFNQAKKLFPSWAVNKKLQREYIREIETAYDPSGMGQLIEMVDYLQGI